MSKGKGTTADALQLLDDFDVGAPAAKKPTGSTAAATGGAEGDAADALAFLDELATAKPAAPGAAAAAAQLDRKSSALPLRPSSRASLTAPTQRRSVEQSRAAIAAARSGSPAPPVVDPTPSTPAPDSGAGSSWGWGSVWNAASAARTAATAAVQQARTVVDEQVKHLPTMQNVQELANNEQARKWSEGVMGYVKQAQLDKISASCLAPVYCQTRLTLHRLQVRI